MKRAVLAVLALVLLQLPSPAVAANAISVRFASYLASPTSVTLVYDDIASATLEEVRVTVDPKPVSIRGALADRVLRIDGPTQRFPVTDQKRIEITFTTKALKVLGAHRARTDFVSAGKVIGSHYFYVSALSGQGARRTPITMLWPITDRPHRGLDNVFIDDQLATDLSPGGRLAQLVQSGAGTTVVWALDPELLASVEQMSLGYQVRRGDQLVDGTGVDVAKAWLNQLRAATASRDVIVLPYADPDLATISAEQLGQLGDYGLRTIERILGRTAFSMSSDVAWPSDGRLSQTALAMRVLITNSRIVTSDATATPAAVGSLRGATRFLISDAVITDALAKGDVDGANRAIAELATITAERPADPRIQLLVPPRMWNPSADALTTLLAATRSDLRGLTHLLNQKPTAHQIPAINAKPYSRTYTDALLSMIKRVKRVQAALGADYEPSLDRLYRSFTAVNANFRTHKSTLINSLDQSSINFVNTLRILPGRYTLTGKEQNIPLTIVNGFDRPVQLSVQIDPHAPRIVVRGTTSVEIPANGRTQLQVPVTSVATGLVAADAYLITSDGERYGDGAVLNVDVRNIGPVANWILYGSAALLALAVALRLTRQIRASRRKSNA